MKIVVAKQSLKDSYFYQVLKSTILGKLVLALAFAILTGLFAQLKFYLPWTPVPVTAQTLVVLTSGVLLGSRWGGLSQFIYVGMGVASFNWFATGKVILLYFWGPSFGYLVGFIFAAVFTGFVVENFKDKLSPMKFFGVLMAINFIMIYIPGMIVLGLWNQQVNGNAVNLYNVIVLGCLSFLPLDMIKIAMVSGLYAVSNGKRSGSNNFT